MIRLSLSASLVASLVLAFACNGEEETKKNDSNNSGGATMGDGDGDGTSSGGNEPSTGGTGSGGETGSGGAELGGFGGNNLGGSDNPEPTISSVSVRAMTNQTSTVIYSDADGVLIESRPIATQGTETVTFRDVPANGSVTVVEADDDTYAVVYTVLGVEDGDVLTLGDPRNQPATKLGSYAYSISNAPGTATQYSTRTTSWSGGGSLPAVPANRDFYDTEMVNGNVEGVTYALDASDNVLGIAFSSDTPTGIAPNQSTIVAFDTWETNPGELSLNVTNALGVEANISSSLAGYLNDSLLSANFFASGSLADTATHSVTGWFLDEAHAGVYLSARFRNGDSRFELYESIVTVPAPGVSTPVARSTSDWLPEFDAAMFDASALTWTYSLPAEAKCYGQDATHVRAILEGERADPQFGLEWYVVAPLQGEVTLPDLSSQFSSTLDSVSPELTYESWQGADFDEVRTSPFVFEPRQWTRAQGQKAKVCATKVER